MRTAMTAVLLGLPLAATAGSPRRAVAPAPLADGRLEAAARAGDHDAIRAMGPGVMKHLAALYTKSDPAQKSTIAYVFYQLAWKSPEARDALLADARTPHVSLRLQVQWALGRVSGDLEVVDVLLANMQHDPNPLFRDKAACALSFDQKHLTEVQKVHLYEGLILALEDPKPDVRRIAALALQYNTGQQKGSVEAWRKWLEEYKAEL